MRWVRQGWLSRRRIRRRGGEGDLPGVREMCRIFRKRWERGKVGEGGVICKEFRDIDGIVPEVNGREGCWVGRAVEEVDGGVVRQTFLKSFIAVADNIS